MNKRPNICILGITGSIGTQTVDVAKKLSYKIVGCSFHKNNQLAKRIIKVNKIKYSFCSDDVNNGNCLSFDDLLKKSKPDIVVNAIVGFAGLGPTLITLQNKINLALANKESVVVAGWYIFDYAKKNHINILPIDSEHTNLYYQLLQAKDKDVNQVFITGSGGKYLTTAKAQKAKVTYEQAINHKNWLMGNKITIDSNTLINKCFEVIEAYWYCHTNKVSVLLDKTSIIHSGIMLNDGQLLLSHSKPDMKTPIAWAISNFQYQIPKNKQKPIQTNILVKLNDIKPISWAYDVMNDPTHSLGIIINAANEVAIQLFKKKMLRFDQIIDYVENSIKRIKRKPIKTIEDIYWFDTYCRLSSIKYWK